MIITKQELIEKLKIFNDDKFKFDEPSHTYRYDGELIYGATSFLERFIKKFDSDFLSKKKAEEEGITQEEMLARLDAKRDRSCDLGHMVHTYIEEFYENNKVNIPKDEEVLERIKKFHTIYDERLNKLESVGSEIKVFSKKYKIAGTIDKLYLFENAVIIGDLKTNAKIKTDKDFCFGKLLFPFESYKENEINKYSLQMSLYALILEEADIHVDYSFICHIPSEGESQIYKLKDFRGELKTYLNHQFINETLDENKIKEDTKLSKLL